MPDIAGIGVETPPRTWRRRIYFGLTDTISRNTSTDVEKTQKTLDRLTDNEKHLHGRGED